MKLFVAAGLVIAATSTQAASCQTGATVFTLIKVAGVRVATIKCNNLPSIFATEAIPRNPEDRAQTYLKQAATHGKCSDTFNFPNPCIATCVVEDPVEAFNTLTGEQEDECKAAGGTYNLKVL